MSSNPTNLALRQCAALEAILGAAPMASVIARTIAENDKNSEIARWPPARKRRFAISQTLSTFGVHPDKLGARATVNALASQGIDISDRALLSRMIAMASGQQRADLTADLTNLNWRDALARRIGGVEADRLIRLCIRQWSQNDQNFDKMNERDQRAEVLRALLNNHGISLKS